MLGDQGGGEFDRRLEAGLDEMLAAVDAAPVPAGAYTRRRRRRWRLLLSSAIPPIGVKLLAATAGLAVAGTAGAAATGHLPTGLPRLLPPRPAEVQPAVPSPGASPATAGSREEPASPAGENERSPATRASEAPDRGESTLPTATTEPRGSEPPEASPTPPASASPHEGESSFSPLPGTPVPGSSPDN